MLKALATGPRVPAIIGNADDANHHRLNRCQHSPSSFEEDLGRTWGRSGGHRHWAAGSPAPSYEDQRAARRPWLTAYMRIA